MSTNINKLFEHPELVENLENAQDIVTTMVDIILKDDFITSSFVSILAHDFVSHTHSLNVSVYAICLGKQMKMNKKTLQELGISALLHDLGKSKIDQSIINKKGKLTDNEFKEVQKHPFCGWLIAKRLGIQNKNILEGIRYHHERNDGTGYPEGLIDRQIHLFARIIGICDVFDALTTKKTYQDSISTFDTLIMMKKEMSQQLDVSIINAFIQILKD